MRNKLAVAALIAVLATVVLAIIRSTDWWTLWRLRRNPDDSAHVAYELCKLGPSVLPAMYSAFDAHGAEPEVANFRIAVSDVLRCVRRDQGATTNEDNAYVDLPANDALTDRIVKAYAEEPDPDKRTDMFVFMSELDFRAEFAVYAGMAQTGYDLPDLYAGVPSVDPHTHPERVERWA